MTAAEFRRTALSLPEATEATHMSHPDFRVGGKIFATLGYPREGYGMVKLAPDEQAFFVKAQPRAISPVKGAWGSAGATTVRLRVASKSAVRSALVAAWCGRAPKRLAQRVDLP
jgi:hypothetical protein